jgi:hypothetical protein
MEVDLSGSMQVDRVFFLLLTIASGPFWLLASDPRRIPMPRRLDHLVDPLDRRVE